MVIGLIFIHCAYLSQHELGDDPWLQDQMLTHLGSKDSWAAAQWATRLAVPPERLSPHIQSCLRLAQQYPDSTLFEDKNIQEQESRRDCYQMTLPLENIHMVDQLECLEKLLPQILQPGSILGLDMEWRPSFSALVQSRVSLLQIAHCQAVYLIDMLALTSQDEGAIVVVPSGATGHPARDIQDAVMSDCKVPHDCPAENMESGKDKASTASRLLTFLQRIFSSTDVLKLGYSLSGDLKNLTRAYPFLAPALKNLECLLDLELLHKQA
uniref:3'-5' exonuclease domain-containing protein n=1 Tax=Eptatretus burgeri TaxID=7764 RepID=A0A8C4QX22_EPTBU